MAQRGTLQPLPLEGVPPLGRMPELSSTSLAELGCISRRVARGEAVFTQGARTGGLFLVREGLLREGAVSPAGRWLVHDLLGPGAVAGSATADGPVTTSVRAVRPSVVEAIPPARFDELLVRHPHAAWVLLTQIERRERRSMELAQELAWCDVPERIRRRLRWLAADHGRTVPGGVLIELPLTQEDLAAMVAAARETVSRALVGLVADGELRIERRRYLLREAMLHRHSSP
jgi:CRP/FNR family transcriptional regulator, cyclic AMP receptor protein